jgi:gliding motility-associated-like protein
MTTPDKAGIKIKALSSGAAKGLKISVFKERSSFSLKKYRNAVSSIVSFSPSTAQPGSIVTITGTQLDNPTSVKIGDTTATILTATANSITAMVMPGAVTGKVSVTNAGGTVSSSGNITIINTPAPVNRQIPNLGDFSGQFITLSADGTVGVVANDGKGKAVYKNSGSGWVLQTVLSETTGAVSINANGTVIATTNSIYDGTSGSWVKLIDSPVEPLLSVAISADGNTVIGAAADKNIYTLQRVGNTYTLGAPAFTLANTKSFGHKLALSADGKTIAISGFSSISADTASIWIYELSGGSWQKQRLLRSNPRNSTYVSPVAISADGNKVMIGYNPEDPASLGYSIIYTRPGQTWAESEGYPDHEGLVTSNSFDIDVHNYISLSADGKVAIIGGKRETDGTFGFWLWKDQLPKIAPVKYKITLQPGKDSIGTDSLKNVATVALSANGSTAFVGVPGALQAGVAVYSNSAGTLPGTPTLQATNVVVSDITPADATINWTKGNGENRVVFVRVYKRFEGDMPEFPYPPDGTYYPANAKFGLGGKLGDWYCVYNGSGSTTKVIGLLQTTQYRVAVIEYNRAPGDEKYLVNYLAPVNPMKPVNFTTPMSTTTPTLPASGITFKNTTDTTTNVNWVNGDGQFMAVFMAKTNTGFAVPVDNVTYSANAVFGKGTQIGSTGWYCVMLGSGNNNFAAIRGLMGNTTYRVAVIPFNNGAGSEKYRVADQVPANVLTKPNPLAPIAPTISSRNLTFTNTTASATKVKWISGNGSYRAVFMAKTGGGVAAPLDSTFYYDNPIFGAGTQIGTTGWYCVYTGTGSSADISGLMSNTTYRVTVVEYNGGVVDVKYLRNNLAPASVVTALSPNDPPTVPSLQLTFSNTTANTTNVSWTSGNGAMRAVFVAKTTGGVAAPVNNNIYTANTAFGSGSQIGSTGWYCVYNGTGNSTAIGGLDPLSTYRVTVVDYNNTGAPNYMNTKLAPASVVTLVSPTAAPTVPSLRLSFSNITPTGTTVSWTSGNGAKRAVFMARRSDGVTSAIDNTTYTGNATFASGTQVGATGWYCVYNGTGNTANISGLAANTTYRVTVIEYNGNAGGEKYMNTMLNPANVTTASVTPTVPSLKLTFTNTTSTTTNVSWTSGNGALRAVFVARTANGVAYAVDNTTYTANQSFAAGTQIGATGWYCVYNGSGNNTNITGLNAYTTYRVTVIEYNGGAGSPLYMNTMLNPASITTLPTGPVPPTTPSLSLNFSNTTSSATTVNWTSGNGFKRAVFVARRSDGVANPIDNTTYTGNPTFAAGTQVGTTGWYCVYNGTAASADITGLNAGTVYRVTVVEYNGTSGSEKYMLTRLAPASITTSSGLGIHRTLASLKADAPAVGEVMAGDIEAANLLSPNGDGKNDTWMVKNIGQYPNNSVTVYDQGSNVVYTKKGYANDWAGTYRGGVVKQGTYYYLIDLGNGTTKKGFITVLSSRQ